MQRWINAQTLVSSPFERKKIRGPMMEPYEAQIFNYPIKIDELKCDRKRVDGA